jgi:hypothetical protein
MHPGNPARSREVIPNDCRCLATNAVLRARVRHLEFSPNPPLASKPQLHASSHFTHTFQMKHLITAIALVFAAGSSFAQATTAVKEAGKATAETSKQATENVKSATTKKPASTTHSAKASAHKSKAQHHGTNSKAAAKEAVK